MNMSGRLTSELPAISWNNVKIMKQRWCKNHWPLFPWVGNALEFMIGKKTASQMVSFHFGQCTERVKVSDTYSRSRQSSKPGSPRVSFLLLKSKALTVKLQLEVQIKLSVGHSTRGVIFVKALQTIWSNHMSYKSFLCQLFFKCTLKRCGWFGWIMASTSPQLNFWCPTSNSLGPARSFFDFLWEIDPKSAKGTYQYLPNLIPVETIRNPNCRTDNATYYLKKYFVWSHFTPHVSRSHRLSSTPPTSPHDWAKTHKNKRQHKVGLGWQNLPALNIPYHHPLLQTKRKKKIRASKHPFTHPLHPINRSLVAWLYSKFHEELRTLTATASRKLVHPTTAFWLILATGSSVSRFH